MTRVREVADHVRSKNAGPFQVTIDLFCGTDEAFGRLCAGLSDGRVAAALGVEAGRLRRFDLPQLRVVKISAPRPTVQGALDDRDMHGASFAVLVAELHLEG